MNHKGKNVVGLSRQTMCVLCLYRLPLLYTFPVDGMDEMDKMDGNDGRDRCSIAGFEQSLAAATGCLGPSADLTCRFLSRRYGYVFRSSFILHPSSLRGL
jgi:hypothetical protein